MEIQDRSPEVGHEHYRKVRCHLRTHAFRDVVFPENQQAENYQKARRAFLVGYDRSVPRLRQASHCIQCNVEEFQRRGNATNTVAAVEEAVDRLANRLGVERPASLTPARIERHVKQASAMPLMLWEDVPDAVRKVRASYEGESIAAYREAMGASSSGRASEAEPSGSTPALAPVLVQEMVDADLAGVAFSANPTGLLNEAVVVVGRGLGDAVVEDRADTTTYYYNKDDKLSYYETDGDAPLLDPEVLTDLVDLVERVEVLYGRPMDVEYAIEGGKVFLLQARPITTLHGTSPTVLDSSNIVESYPGLTLPLSQSFAKDIYYEIFKALLTRATGKDPILGTLDDVLKDMVAMANGRVYYRITSWYDILRLMPFSEWVTSPSPPRLKKYLLASSH